MQLWKPLWEVRSDSLPKHRASRRRMCLTKRKENMESTEEKSEALLLSENAHAGYGHPRVLGTKGGWSTWQYLVLHDPADKRITNAARQDGATSVRMTGVHLKETPGSEKEELVRLQSSCLRKRTFLKIKNLVAWKRGTPRFTYKLPMQCPILLCSVSTCYCLLWVRHQSSTQYRTNTRFLSSHSLMTRQTPHSLAFSPFLPSLLPPGLWILGCSRAQPLGCFSLLSTHSLHLTSSGLMAVSTIHTLVTPKFTSPIETSPPNFKRLPNKCIWKALQARWLKLNPW